MTVGELITELTKYKMDDDVYISIDDKTKIGTITNTTYFKGMCEIHFNNWTNPIQIPEGATRRDLHKLVFGIDVPELDSDKFRCAREKGCSNCKHKDNINCDMVWWNSPYRKEQE